MLSHFHSCSAARRPITRGVSTVEEIYVSLAALVAQRQGLRATTADASLLEQNRVEIARLQRHLSDALIKRYLPAAA
jgi:hypothetical protein